METNRYYKNALQIQGKRIEFARQQFAQTIEKEGCICVSQTVICFVNIITIQLVSNKKLNFVTLYLKDLSKIKHIFLKFPQSI